jgi:hypothetical protein
MKPITWKSPMKAELLALALALAASPLHASEHDDAASIEFASTTRPVSRTSTTKPRRPLTVVITPQSNASWYLGTSPVHLVDSSSNLRSVFAVGYSGRAGSSLQYEFRVSRESSTSTRVQFAMKF